MSIETVSYRSRAAWGTAALLIAALLLWAFVAVSPAAASSDPIQRGIDADAARYQAMGEFYLAKIQRGIEAGAARYQAMGEFYLAQASGPQMPYTDVSKFYAERLRAQIRASSAIIVDNSDLAKDPELMFARRFYGVPGSFLALNPELMVARRAYRAPASFLALNPELMVARQAYSQGLAACALDDEGTLAQNPELIIARRISGSC